jgi:hypothetical protein
MGGAGSDIPRKDGANLSHHTATLQLLCSNEPSRAALRASAKGTQKIQFRRDDAILRDRMR